MVSAPQTGQINPEFTTSVWNAIRNMFFTDKFLYSSSSL